LQPSGWRGSGKEERPEKEQRHVSENQFTNTHSEKKEKEK
jgi:hypothetical protein